VMARIRKRQMPRNIELALGGLGKVALMFAADDPRWYAQTQQASVTPPTKTAGFSFPMKFPLSFGGGSVAGSLAVTNAGNIETRPLLIVEGPCESPSITNITAEGSPNLQFNLTIASGAKLVIDTDFHTATYYTAGTTLGSTRLGTLAYGSEWFTLGVGTSTLQFLAGTNEGTLSVQWASAWIL
jgi:Phage tail protein